MLKLILVPLDTSTFAEQALPHACALARRAQAHVQLICVRPSQPLSSGRGEALEKYLGTIAAQLGPQLPGGITYSVVSDQFGTVPDLPSVAHAVADVISRYATEHDVDVCVMATHGRGGVQRAWLGSVADVFIRNAPRPVLLIRPKDEAFGSAASADRGIGHIVIPVDGSEMAERVIPCALEIGTPFGARYTVLRIVSPLVWTPYETWASLPPAPLSRQEAVDYVERVASGLRAQGAAVTARVINAVSPAPAIVDYATTHAADAIALSTEGAGGVRLMLLGSVADKVVRSSDIPVLVCNIRRLEQETALVRGSVAAAVAAVT